MASNALVRKGKVREVYDIGDHFLMIASDRISAFDWVLPSLIRDKGRLLTQISRFWFEHFPEFPNHLVSTSLKNVALPHGLSVSECEGRSMVVKKCEVVPIECVVRGYLVGSGWKDYQNSGQVCGIKLPDRLENCSQLSEPLFTPATKAEEGHDENISFEQAANVIGSDVAQTLRDRSIEIYLKGSQFAREKGIILADTKFEFGWHNGELLLIDEVLTPDSSRFWPGDDYEPGRNQRSFDKQFVREYLESTPWDKNSEPPELPKDIIEKTRAKYVEAFERLTGETFQWQ